MPALYTHTTRANGTVLTAAIYNSDHQNHIDNGIPTSLDDYSISVGQMQATTDPGESGSESLATSLAGEIERLRFAIKDVSDFIGLTKVQWYSTPTGNVVKSFPAGTRMLFQQTSAPTGWTKDVTAALNDSALRVVTGAVGSGGTDAFSAVFVAGKSTATDGSGTTGSTVLDGTMIPSHTHGISITSATESVGHTHTGTTSSDGAHTHTITVSTASGGAITAINEITVALTTASRTTSSDGAHTHTMTTGGVSATHTHLVSGTSGATGGGLGHTHTTPAHSHAVPTMNLKFNDVIIASKD